MPRYLTLLVAAYVVPGAAAACAAWSLYLVAGGGRGPADVRNVTAPGRRMRHR